MRTSRFFLLLTISAAVLGISQVQAAGLAASNSRFYYRDFAGQPASARIMRYYWRGQNARPAAQIDPRIDPRLRRAATIGEERANARSKARCWQYVKEALLKSGAVSSYPKTAYAYQAGEELTRHYGFTRLSMRDPYAAPVGAVLVYGGRGHVEIRTSDGFVSDYHSRNRCFYPLIAVYAKFSS